MNSDIDFVLAHVAAIPLPMLGKYIQTSMPVEVILAARRAIEPSIEARAYNGLAKPGFQQ